MKKLLSLLMPALVAVSINARDRVDSIRQRFLTATQPL